MVPKLIEHCASRGGCCGRGCGCCRQRALASQRKQSRGHCTVECACCIQDRGFELTEEEKDQNRLKFENSLWARDAEYALELIVGYFRLVILERDPAYKKEKLKDRPATKDPASPTLTSKDSEKSESKDLPPPYGDSGGVVGDGPQKSPRSKLKQALRFWF